ncbi:MAG: polymer-forming cytoskeletal protein [bacterium]
MFGIDFNENESVKTSLGPDTTFEGVIQTDESLRIDGSFEGTIDCSGTLIVGSGADLEADISAESAIIGGRVEGDITASEKIEIRRNGEIYGDLVAPVLRIERGVKLEGNCTINTGDGDDEAKVTSIKEKLG